MTDGVGRQARDLPNPSGDRADNAVSRSAYITRPQPRILPPAIPRDEGHPGTSSEARMALLSSLTAAGRGQPSLHRSSPRSGDGPGDIHTLLRLRGVIEV
jgi:hypothetical protein